MFLSRTLERKMKEQFEYGTLYLGDAKELIREIPNNSVDLILTDPPFGLNMDEYDDGNALFDLEDELWRVTKFNAWLVSYWSTKMLAGIFKLRQFQYAWQMICKFEHTFSKWIGGDRSYLPVMIFRKGNPKVLYRRSDIVPSEELPIVFEKVRNAQFKPTIATSILLQMFSRDSDIVLDPFAGFGSIPLVCECFRKNWIAIEIDHRKYDIAIKFLREKRAGRIILDKTGEQLPMFEGTSILRENELNINRKQLLQDL